MNPDDFKQAYQGHPRLAGDAESLVKEVQRNEQSFNAMIFWRDFREIGIALLLLPAWLYLGIMFQPAWSPPCGATCRVDARASERPLPSCSGE